MRPYHSRGLMSGDKLWKIFSYPLVIYLRLLTKLDQQNPLQLPLAWVLFLRIKVDCNTCQCKSISSYLSNTSLRKLIRSHLSNPDSRHQEKLIQVLSHLSYQPQPLLAHLPTTSHCPPMLALQPPVSLRLFQNLSQRLVEQKILSTGKFVHA